MRFDQIAPFMRSISFGMTGQSRYEEMIGYESRLFYIADGSGELEIQKKPHTLKKGDLVIINSGVPYRIRFVQGAVKYYMIKFDCTQEHTDIASDNPADRPRDFVPHKVLSHMDFEDAPQFGTFCILRNMNHTENLIRMIFDEERKRLIGWRAIANGLLAEILSKCLRADTGYSDTSQLKDVIDYLQSCYSAPVSNAEIAARFGYHPNYLSNLFVKITGKSMHQYLISLRISHSAELLETTTLPISEVATMCGFENCSKFSAMFKRETGKTPTQYRQSCRS